MQLVMMMMTILDDEYDNLVDFENDDDDQYCDGNDDDNDGDGDAGNYEAMIFMVKMMMMILIGMRIMISMIVKILHRDR